MSAASDPLAELLGASVDTHRALLGKEGYRLPDCSGLMRTALLAGANNAIYGPDGFSGFGFDIDSSARNNTIIIDQQCHCVGKIILRGSNNLIIVRGSREGHNPINIHMFSDRGLFFFGDHATSNSATFEISGDDKSIIVGEDCMFSAYIDVETDDRHGIFDLASGDYLNPPESVHFNPHVWVGLHATILKGVEIGFGSVVAARTVVSKSVPEMVAIGGVPAAVIKRGVSWTRAKTPTPGEQARVRDEYERLKEVRCANPRSR